MVLRRTKEELGQLKLTERKVETHTIQLQSQEHDIYQVLYSEARYR